MRGFRRDKRDNLFSKMIRFRDEFTCCRCGALHEETSSGLHCSHNVPRTYLRLRWTPLNALALCYRCHMWYGGEPYESGAWLAEHMGDRMHRELLSMKQQKLKISKSAKEDIYDILKEDRAAQLEKFEQGKKHKLRDPVMVLLKAGLL